MHHRHIDRRSLALHVAVAAKIRAQPALLSEVKARWKKRVREADPADTAWLTLLEWQNLLDAFSPDDLLAFLASSTPDAQRLRQSSPFAGLLSSDERATIFAHYETFRT